MYLCRYRWNAHDLVLWWRVDCTLQLWYWSKNKICQFILSFQANSVIYRRTTKQTRPMRCVFSLGLCLISSNNRLNCSCARNFFAKSAVVTTDSPLGPVFYWNSDEESSLLYIESIFCSWTRRSTESISYISLIMLLTRSTARRKLMVCFEQ